MSNSVCSVFRILDVLISMQYVHWMRINSDLFVTWVGFFGWVGVFLWSLAILTLLTCSTMKDILSMSASPIN